MIYCSHSLITFGRLVSIVCAAFETSLTPFQDTPWQFLEDEDENEVSRPQLPYYSHVGYYKVK